MVALRSDGLPVGIAREMTDEEAALLESMFISHYLQLDREGDRAGGNQQYIKDVSHRLDVWSRLVFRLHYFHKDLLRPCELEEKISRLMEVIE